MDARRQWFVVDPDPDRMPTQVLLDKAVAGPAGTVGKTLAGLNPVNPDYGKLKADLAATKDPARRKLIVANMDRWRWLPQALGKFYLLTNIPEQKLRLTVNNRIIKSYRTIVGKPGRTATPQLAETVEAVIYNPTWTVPQSIVKGEGLGAKVLGNPGWAKAAGYKGTKGENGWITVVQQPGPTNSLGLMKLDMPERARHLPARYAGAEPLRSGEPRAVAWLYPCGERPRGGDDHVDAWQHDDQGRHSGNPAGGVGDYRERQIHALSAREPVAGLSHLFHDGI